MLSAMQQGGQQPQSSTLLPGDPAPDFSAPQDRGQPFRLSDYRGRWVLLFFFPRASTSYC
jgi:thioredoxin-dependent peroxiredoxin